MSTPEVIQICNEALLRLGEEGLSDTFDMTDPSGTAGVVCSARFDAVAKFILALHPWHSVIKRASLSTGDSPAFGYTYGYDLPTDLLRLVEVYLSGYRRADIQRLYRIENGQILTNETEVEIKYVWYPSSTHATSNNSTWNAYIQSLSDPVREVIVSRLALDISKAVSDASANDRMELRVGYQEALESALLIECGEDVLSQLGCTDLIEARFSGNTDITFQSP